MKKIVSIALLSLVAVAGAFAQVFDFTVVNDTGYTINSLFVTPSDSTKWGDDVLGRDQLKDEEEVDIVFPKLYEAMLLAFGVDLYDLRIEYTDGTYDEYYDLKLEEINELTLSLDKKGNGFATWE